MLAHEFGHAIQSRANELSEPTILKEQQADCFAGAWSAHVARGEADGLTFGDKELKQGLIAMIQVRDPIDGSASVDDPNAHGTGFDRVGAFQDGFTGGTERCKTFFTEDREKNLIDIPFDRHTTRPATCRSTPDRPTGGDIKTLMPADLDRFWVQKLSGIDGVSFTAPTLQLFTADGPLPDCDGVDNADFKANGSSTAPRRTRSSSTRTWPSSSTPTSCSATCPSATSSARPTARPCSTRSSSTLTGEDRGCCSNDCFTGAWVADDIPPLSAERRGPNAISLSAGDLDEAIITALKRSDESRRHDKRGTAFEKIAAFRAGVLGGMHACQDRIAP